MVQPMNILFPAVESVYHSGILQTSSAAIECWWVDPKTSNLNHANTNTPVMHPVNSIYCYNEYHSGVLQTFRAATVGMSVI